MPSTIIIGCDARAGTTDALALATLLAPPDARLLVASAVPPRLLSQHVPAEVRRAGDDVLEGAAARLGGRHVEHRILHGRSPAQALVVLAEDEHADLLIVGSSQDAELDRVRAGSVATGLLAGAPCPVAIAPARFAADHPARLARVGIAWNGTAAARAACALAAELLPDADTRLVEVLNLDMSHVLWGYEGFAYALGTYPQELRIEARKRFDVARHEQGLPGELREGDPAGQLLLASTDLDLLVMGSHGYGALRRAVLGSVSSQVVHDARCAVVVVPQAAVADEPHARAAATAPGR